MSISSIICSVCVLITHVGFCFALVLTLCFIAFIWTINGFKIYNMIVFLLEVA